MKFITFLALFIGFLYFGGVNAAHDMDVAGEQLATNALRGQFVMTDKVRALLDKEQKGNSWQGWSAPGELSEDELLELEGLISEKMNNGKKLQEFLNSLKESGLNMADQETVLLLLPDLIAIVQ